MKHKILCPVCQVAFLQEGHLKPQEVVICPVCGAKLEVTEVEPEISARKLEQPPQEEIEQRIEAFAKLRGFVFNEDRGMVLEGLMEKKKQFGDFFCPCKFDNIPENICPCLETRKGFVRKEGRCHCGLFNASKG
ncbi:ferredoxin-thioredoxin reductase catalytic domain-containing protein [Desulforamulus ruminis]|uniref:Uncharacterized protein n=1 Tax=Desulforamulus ruminis (strain ATCC 23193 / DSM 2154 / NCIMB 8452 / DL) TaxID=696281 RepID=F6DUU3_DESRL|nr:ferredoxin-thioredoxin reductase catalytic domain-containing protein [Desulforamulus ruminis]AEG60231.1 hypothetical protein Desru_1975 [Desulforamulus ruminis DSM 2154]